jgi:hypothetical protein
MPWRRSFCGLRTPLYLEPDLDMGCHGAQTPEYCRPDTSVDDETRRFGLCARTTRERSSPQKALGNAPPVDENVLTRDEVCMRAGEEGPGARIAAY